MTKDVVLVSAELAKEKLASEIEVLASPHSACGIPKFGPNDTINSGWISGHLPTCPMAIAQLIRNTDLTDCQPQGYFETNCAGDKCIANTTGCQRGHCQLKNFNPVTGQMTIMNEHSSGTRAEVPPSATDSGTPRLDLQMTKLCAEAAGLNWADEEARRVRLDGAWRTHQETEYDPLHNDAQAMALLKRFPMDVFADRGNPFWRVRFAADHNKGYGLADDLNRAIVECVAMMQVDGTAQEASTVARRNERDGVADQGSVRNSTDKVAAGAQRLVYNKITRTIDKVRNQDGLVIESFDPPSECG